MESSYLLLSFLISFFLVIRNVNGFLILPIRSFNNHHKAYIDEYHFNTKSTIQNDYQSIPNENKYVGGGTVGDIMSTNTTSDDETILKSGLVTSFPHGTIQSQFGSKVGTISPLERIALTANGNLQRIFSSYYDAPVEVIVECCERRVDDDSVWDRCVHLDIFNQKFCRATSEVRVHSKECIALVQSGKVGIGQLFRYLDRLPTFELIDVGRCDNGGLWREYVLECKEVSCKIHEELIPNAWELTNNANN